MVMHVVFCLILIFHIQTTTCIETPTLNTLNKTCIDDVILGFNFYQTRCPEAEAIILPLVESAVSLDPRMAASLLRLHFHDCFVNARRINHLCSAKTNANLLLIQGCDASVLLDDTEGFVGEKTAPPNANSLRGFEVIDTIKLALESACPETVSCADILAVTARDAVALSGGPRWEVQMGRKDSVEASKDAATRAIPAPTSSVQTLISSFQTVGLTWQDMVALSGGHTIGKARCSSFSSTLQTNADTISEFIRTLQQMCSEEEAANVAAALDSITPATFDNQYYLNLMAGEGLLTSDRNLVGRNDAVRQLVEGYAKDQQIFFKDFSEAMVKMGSLGGKNGEIRRNCRSVN